jgi:hypothetical protein
MEATMSARLQEARQAHIEDISRRLGVTETLARASILLVGDDPGTVERWVRVYGSHLSPSQQRGVYRLIREYGGATDEDCEDLDNGVLRHSGAEIRHSKPWAGSAD